MPDLLDHARDGRNWIERIADRIPGFAGYQNRETRREVDRVWRGHLAGRVDAVRQKLNDRIRELSGAGNLDAVSGLDGAEKSLDGLANRVRTADSGYSGFFDAVKVGEKELDEVYRFDLGFADEVDGLAKLVDSVGSAGGPDGRAMRRAVDEALERWKQRAALLDLAAGIGR